MMSKKKKSDTKQDPLPSTIEPETTAVNETAQPEQSSRAFPIVGIGASAGGLAAFEQFFSAMPAESESGMAFVLVQHLSPDHKSILTELVKRYTPMHVYEVEDGMEVMPNCTYIIPPNRDMAILNGTLRLLEPGSPRGIRLPIDFFFRSLAQDQHERAICVVLSGTGTDGTLGVRAVKGEGGMVVVQDPASTSYDGMPRSAIATGLVDDVLPPDEMPPRLIAYVSHAFGKRTIPATPPPPKMEDTLQKICILIRAQTGHDFSQYKQNTLIRRVERRMALAQLAQMDDYLHFLQKSTVELDALFRDMLIGVTSFFRDPEAFQVLETEAIPRLFANKTPSADIRVWVCGCSTGEEAYSLAILILEHMETLKQTFKVQIFATDIDRQAIEQARSGLFPGSIATDITPARLTRYFTLDEESNSYRVQKSVRDLLVFSEHNVIKDPPFSRLDMISCRNLLIYMNGDLQKRIIPLFHYALNPEGTLFLGASETVGEYLNIFQPLNRKWKIYQRQEYPAGSSYFPLDDFAQPLVKTTIARERPFYDKKQINLQKLTQQALLDYYGPTGVLVNGRGEILHIYGRTSKYLEPAPGDDAMNILAMARSGLKRELTAALRQAVIEKQPVHYHGLRVLTHDNMIVVDLAVRPITTDEQEDALPDIYLVILEERPELSEELAGKDSKGQPFSSDAQAHIAALELELRGKEEYLQTTIEELETTNEELQLANEELQSTNEELETSNEELQSTNEELATVNIKLQASEARYRAVVEDQTEVISRFTADGKFIFVNDVYCRFFGKTADELIGQKWHPVAVTEDLPDIEEKLQMLSASNPVVVIENRVYAGDGRIHWMQFVNRGFFDEKDRLAEIQSVGRDICERKQAEEELSKYRENLEELVKERTRELEAEINERKRAEETAVAAQIFLDNVLDMSPFAMWICDQEGTVIRTNQSLRQTINLTDAAILGQYNVFKDNNLVQQGVMPLVKAVFEKYKPARFSVPWQAALAGDVDFSGGRDMVIDVSMFPIVNAQNELTNVVCQWVDITEQKQAEQKLKESEERLALVLEGSQLGYWDWNIKTGAVQRNEQWAAMLGYTLPEIELNVKQWSDLHHPDDRAAAMQSIQDHLDGRTPEHHAEYRMRCKNGEYKWILDQARVVERDAQGNPLRMSGTHTDITERKQAEEQSRRQAAILATLLNSPQETVALLDTDGNVLTINLNGAKRFGMLPEAMIGKNIYTLLPEPVSSQRKKLITEVMQTDQPAHFEDQRQDMHFMNSVYPVDDPQSGELLGVAIFALDITNRKRAEEALRQSNRRLEETLTELQETQEQMMHQERLAAVGQLAAGIAHDFNNIMATITLYSQTTMLASGLTQRERERMATINEQAWHASHLVQQILDFSRKAMLQMQPINFSSLLQDQIALLERTLPEHIDIQLIGESDGFTVNADQTRMQQMITNLAVNARDAMPQGGTLTIEQKSITIKPGQQPPLSEMGPGNWLKLSMKDTGTGIAPEVLPHIFEPFFTTKGPGAGSGLGLAQVHGIVGQHGGYMAVDTQQGVGTTFTIYLPAMEVDQKEVSSLEFSKLPRGEGELVLLVEDNASLRAALTATLEALNYRTIEAENGREALRLVEGMGDQIALILSDVIMPEMGGKDLFLALKAQGRQTPVVLLSGHSLDATLDELVGQGLATWLTKPPSFESLAKALAGALRK